MTQIRVSQMSKGKDSLKESSRALKRLEAHNKSPKVIAEVEVNSAHEGSSRDESGSRKSHRSERSGVRERSETRERSVEIETRRGSRCRSRVSDREERRSRRKKRRSRSRSRHRSRRESRTSSRHSEPPEWAMAILDQQKRNAEELQRLKSGLAANSSAHSSADSSSKAKAAQPEFRFEGNKKQYQINCSVIGQLDRALASNDREEINREVTEGKKVLAERNKHILLAEKYGWDTVHCYTAEPLASDSEDEKKIRKAVKESKAMRVEKKATAARPKGRKPANNQRRGSSWGEFFAKTSQVRQPSSKASLG